MLPEPSMQCPSHIADIARNLEPKASTPTPPPTTIFRKCIIHEPDKIVIHSDILYDRFISPFESPHSLFHESIFRGYRTTLHIDISLVEAYTCCKEYHVPIRPFITYEESDLDWLTYCGIAKCYSQSILNADTIHIVFTKDGTQQTIATKLLPSNPLPRQVATETVTISLLVIPDLH